MLSMEDFSKNFSNFFFEKLCVFLKLVHVQDYCRNCGFNQLLPTRLTASYAAIIEFFFEYYETS